MINLSSGDLYGTKFKKKLLKQAISTIQPNNLLSYPNTLGLTSLREKIKNSLFPTSRKETLITGSATEALSILNKLYANKTMAIQTPYYFGVGRQTQECKTFMWENVNELEKLCKTQRIEVIYLTSNFHSVTTKSLTDSEKQRVIQIATQFDIIIIEDNPNDFLYKDKLPSNLTNQYEKSIYVGSFSKIVAPGIRLGFIHANPTIMKQIKSDKITSNLSTNITSQIIADFMMQPHVIKQITTNFQKKLNLVEKQLKKYQIEFEPIKGGIFINIPIQQDLLDVINKLKNNGIYIEENKFSYPNKKNRNVLKINFLKNNKKQNNNAFKIIKSCL